MFRCKQFTVAQDKCAMKVNTDSLILGSWAQFRANLSHAPRILDIGTGSGILALMMAQKAVHFCNPNGEEQNVQSSSIDISSFDNGAARIDAIEIDEQAAAQAATNFKNAKWAKQLFIYCCDVTGYTSPHLYDLVISNPPYFDTPATLSNAYSKQSQSRSVARQTSALGPDELFSASSKFLIEQGQMYCVYPASMEASVIETAEGYGLSLADILYVKHTSNKSPYLCAFHFKKVMEGASDNFKNVTAHREWPSLIAKNAIKNELIIRDQRGEYTSEYKALCQPFYLKF